MVKSLTTKETQSPDSDRGSQMEHKEIHELIRLKITNATLPKEFCLLFLSFALLSTNIDAANNKLCGRKLNKGFSPGRWYLYG